MIGSAAMAAKPLKDVALSALKRALATHETRPTQAMLNHYFEGGQLDLIKRYSVSLITIFVCTFYSAGAPLMYPIACVSFAFGYAADKYFLLRYYKKPPMYGPELAGAVAQVLPYAVVGHLIGALA